MSYYSEITEQKFYVPAKWASKVFRMTRSEEDGRGYDFDFDQEGNLVHISISEYVGAERNFLEKIAYYVGDGSYIEMLGESGKKWRWEFNHGEVKWVDLSKSPQNILNDFECETKDCCYNHEGMCRYAKVHEVQPHITERDGCTSGVLDIGGW